MSRLVKKPRPGGRLAARLLVIALVAGVLPFVGQQQASALGTNDSIASWAPAGTSDVAPQATVTANSSQAQWPPSKLVDGDVGTSDLNVWVSGEDGASAGGWVKLAFPYDQTGISRITLFPRGESTFYGVYFPTVYTVSLLDASDQVLWSATVHHPNSDKIDSRIITVPDVIDLPVPMTARSVKIDVLERHAREVYGLQMSEIAVFAGALEPATLTDLALASTVSFSSSYQQPSEGWDASFVNNGMAGNVDGWSTNPYEKVADPATNAWLEYDLNGSSTIDKVIVSPRVRASNNFPRDYQIQVSNDNQSWTTVAAKTGNSNDQQDAQVFTFSPAVAARYVRLNTTLRNGPSGGDGYLVQLSEFGVYGDREGSLTLKKAALRMAPGATESSWFYALDVKTPYTATSSDPSVARADSAGTITAVADGQATITLTSADGKSVSVPVTVTQDKLIGDNIVIAGFWPPTPDKVNQQQFATAADFGLDLLMGSDEHPSLAENMTMAQLAADNGFNMMPQDMRMGCGGFAGQSTAAVQDIVKDYANVAGVAGVTVCDEAMPATNYAAAFNTTRSFAPALYPHYNFCPWGACGVDDASVRAWLDATGGVRSDWSAPDYLMFDRYPISTGGIDYQGWFTNLNNFRNLGLEYKIKTATYLEAVGFNGVGMRQPASSEIVWEANTALAYGYKQLSYFTYWQPTNRSEDFTQGVMKADGTKSDRFDSLKQLNSEVHALGPTLMKLDAKEVYLNGQTWGQQGVPTDFFAHAPSGNNLTLSYLRDRVSGRNYLMVVNNNASASQSFALQFDPMIGSVQKVSRSTGELSSNALSGNQVNLSLAAGQAELFALPNGYDYENRPANVAAGKTVSVSSSAPDATYAQWGWSAGNLVDGRTDNGWTSAIGRNSSPDSTEWAAVNLGSQYDVKQIVVYPIGFFAVDYQVQVSTDGNNWQTVATVTGDDGDTSAPRGFTLDTPKQASHVRVISSKLRPAVPAADGYLMQIADVQVFAA